MKVTTASPNAPFAVTHCVCTKSVCVNPCVSGIYMQWTMIHVIESCIFFSHKNRRPRVCITRLWSCCVPRRCVFRVFLTYATNTLSAHGNADRRNMIYIWCFIIRNRHAISVCYPLLFFPFGWQPVFTCHPADPISVFDK